MYSKGPEAGAVFVAMLYHGPVTIEARSTGLRRLSLPVGVSCVWPFSQELAARLAHGERCQWQHYGAIGPYCLGGRSTDVLAFSQSHGTQFVRRTR